MVTESLPRAVVTIDSVQEVVSQIIAEVKDQSIAALTSHAEKFDGLVDIDFRVPKTELVAALQEMDPELRAAIEVAISRVRKVSEATVPSELTVELDSGAQVTQKFVPVASVGLYVPGGKAVYPSSVVMNVVPARVAKVPRIAVTSPAQKDGLPSRSVLATCELLGIDEVYAMGGASAVAAFAYGIPEIDLEPVAMVTGPGNIFVAAAKRQLRGVIGIDSEAGPTEILIIADQTANPEFVAADLISQAEHDPNAAAVLVTDSPALIVAVEQALDKQIPLAANHSRISQALAGIQSALVLVDSIESAIQVANAYATEHLEIHCADSQAVASQITNAGAVFIGRFTPVSLGDYSAGSNHVLPTGGCACHSSGLSVQTFLRGLHFIEYDQKAFTDIVDTVVVLANSEDLPAHGEAMTVRLENL